MDNNFIGNRIKYFRKNSKLTLTQLANLINSSAGFLSDIEKGKSLPSIPKLVEICKALGITLTEFFASEDISDTLRDDLKELLDNAKNLNSEQLKLLSNFLKSLNPH